MKEISLVNNSVKYNPPPAQHGTLEIQSCSTTPCTYHSRFISPVYFTNHVFYPTLGLLNFYDLS